MSTRILAAVSMALVLAAGTGTASAGGPVVRVVNSLSELPEAFRPFGAAGDILVTDARYAALVAGSSRALRSALNTALPDPHGQIVAFVPVGATARPLALVGAPSLRTGGTTPAVKVVSVLPEGQAVVVRSAGTVGGVGTLDVTTRYEFDFDSGRISVVAEVRNAGQREAQRVSFGLGASFLQSLAFGPYHASVFPSLNFRVYQRPDHVLGWWNPNPADSSEKPLPGLLKPGQTHRMTYSLVAGKDISDVLDRLYAAARVKAERQVIELRAAGAAKQETSGLPAGFETVEVAISEPATGALFYRAFLHRPASVSVPLPDGTYHVRVNAFPAVSERTFRRPALDAAGAPTAWPIDLPALGTIRVSVRDSKRLPVPGKVSFIGLAPVGTPYFEPENPVESARGWESLNNSVYPGAAGETIRLPAGTYLAVAARGPAYTRETRVLEIYGGANADADFTVDKVVETTGLIAVDAHLHTTFSDGQMRIAERLKGVVAEGVEVAIATDHNYVTDYRPELARLGLASELAVITGNEVTGRGGNIHFNSYPVAPNVEDPGNGAISVQDSTPSLLFGTTRRKDPGAVVQVNHPRSQGLGYFLTYKLDPETAATAAAPFVMDFDVMEGMNGAELNGPNRATIEDWFHFLNRGYPVRLVGTSDAHGQDGGEPGYARTYVLYDGPKGASLEVPTLMKRIKEGRSFVSNGPVVVARANGKSTYGDSLTAKDGRVALDIEVHAAPWVDVSQVRLVVNGVRQDAIAVSGVAGGTKKYAGRTELTLNRDAWIAVEVSGRKTLFPTVQQRTGNRAPESGPMPYALTNPILVDVDGDGKVAPIWTPGVAVR